MFRRRKILRAALLAVPLALQAVAATPDPLLQAFLSPPKSARPMLRWWWPGGDVTDRGIQEQIAQFDAAGFGGLEIQPFDIGLHHLPAEQRARVDNFATPDFFAHVAAAARAAHARGLFIDTTFGSGWPFGGGREITPELSQMELALSRQTVRGPGPLPGPILVPGQPGGSSMMRTRLLPPPREMPPDWRQRLLDRARIIAVVAAPGSAPQSAPYPSGRIPAPAQDLGLVVQPGKLQAQLPLVLTDRLRPDGTLNWRVPPGEWQLFVFRQFASDLFVVGGVGAGPQLVIDHFRRDAFAAHAQRVGDRALPFLTPYIGKGWRAIFVDSPELPADAYWTAGFLDEFRRRRGYDLTPYLPLIFEPHWLNPYLPVDDGPLYIMTGVADRVRADYRLTLSELMQQNFFAPFADWASRHGLLSRIQAHGSPTELIRSYGLADIPETEDLFAGVAPDLLKTARAAADIYGKKWVSSESFIISGEAFGVTPGMLKVRADQLFANGVNEIVAHGAPYPYEANPGQAESRHAGNLAVGWYPFGTGFSSYLSARNPIWPYLKPLTSYITRMQAVLRATDNVVPVAIYRDRVGYQPAPVGKTAPEPAVDTVLARAGYDFDPINADGLARSRIEARALVTPGGARYQVLVMPYVSALRAETAERIASFAKSGLPIVFVGEVPQREEGFNDSAHRDARVAAAMQSIGPRRPLPGEPELVAVLRAEGVSPNLTFLDGTYAPFIEKRLARRQLFFLFNPDPTPRRVSLSLPLRARVTTWDAWNATITPLSSTRATAGDRTEAGDRIDVELAPLASTVLVLDPDRSPSQLSQPGTKSPGQQHGVNATLPLGKDGWRFVATGFDSTGHPVSRQRASVTLGSWTDDPGLQDFAGEAHYETTINITSESLLHGARWILDLGEIHDVAAVRMDGAAPIVLSIPPYQADVTNVLHVGTNFVDITVANTPFNVTRDAKTSSPRPAGLLGPVVLQRSVVTSLPQGVPRRDSSAASATHPARWAAHSDHPPTALIATAHPG